MSNSSQPAIGAIIWQDLTVADAASVRDFYAAVVGWNSSEVDVGGYADYNMHRGDGEVVAGICYARGVNAAFPSQWLVYITVADLDESITRCVELGGQLLVGPKSASGESRMCVIRDPAGAVAALLQPAQ